MVANAATIKYIVDKTVLSRLVCNKIITIRLVDGQDNTLKTQK